MSSPQSRPQTPDHVSAALDEKAIAQDYSVDSVQVAGSDSDSEVGELKWTLEEEKAVRRKLDYHIVPLMAVLYMLCFIDRSSIGNARIQGMSTDLDLTGYRLNWALTVFYFTYIACEIPSNIALKRFGPRFWIPFLVAGFGLASLCTAFVTDFAGLCTSRAFLGLFEGGTMPGIAFFLSCFYKREELLFRVGLFVNSASLANAFGGLLATGLTRIPEWGTSALRIHTWRNIFFFEGLVTVLFALIAPFFMQTKPEECKFLTPRERQIAKQRLLREHSADPNETVKAHHVKKALFNVNNMVCAGGFFLINITVTSFSLFLPSILKEFGWTSTKAQLYSVPPYACACVVAIAIAFVSDRTKMRGIYLAAMEILPLIGFSLLRVSTDQHVKYAGVYLAAIGAFPGGSGFLSWGLNNAAGPAVRAVSGAVIVSLGSLGAIVATWAYLPNDAPRYPIGHSINIGSSAAVLVLAIAGLLYCLWENRMRAQGKRDSRLEGLSEQEEVNLGHHHPSFRYIP